ncbi:MAG TPA: DUF4905 domain-containing protein [Cyclobacteriaceae bacterium]
MKNLFSHKFDSKIWKTVFNSDQGLIALELRDNDTQRLSFVIVRIPNGKILFKSKNHEKWWASLIGVTSDILLIQEYEDENNPESKRITLLEWGKNRILKEIENVQVESVDQNQLIVSKSGGKPFVYDLKTLKIIEQHIPSDCSDVQFPLIYSVESEYFGYFSRLITIKFNMEPVIACEYLDFDRFLIIGFYVRSHPGLDQYITIIDKNNSVEFLKKIESELDKPSMETYFLWKQTLIFVSEKHILEAHEIN